MDSTTETHPQRPRTPAHLLFVAIALVPAGCCNPWTEQPACEHPTTILQHPVGQNRMLVGGTATFSVQASGAEPLEYQWRFQGEPIEDGPRYTGTQTSNLTIHNVGVDVGGRYDVVVLGPCGTVTSEGGFLIAWVVDRP